MYCSIAESLLGNRKISWKEFLGFSCRTDADAKLGWTPYQSVVVPLSAIRLGGGTAPRTAVVVQRRFPALYWDTLSDGRSMRRTARAKAAADRMAEGHAEKVCSRLGPACLLLQAGAMHNYFGFRPPS